ncbi:Copia protein, partial [Mucuna pruriens]
MGKLIYLSHTMPDIAYAISVVSQFMHDPKERHLQAASPRKGLFKKEGILSMEICTDVDYARSVVDRRSTSGYCMFWGGNLVTWRSKRQSVVTQSSVEVEFQAMTHGICEGLWMKIILNDLKVEYERPIKHFIKEKLNSRLVVITHVPTGLQVEDVFTKRLRVARFHELTSKLGMIDIHLPT